MKDNSLIAAFAARTLVCSAGHRWDVSTQAGRWACGDRKAGQPCPMVLGYDRMASPATRYCRRVLRSLPNVAMSHGEDGPRPNL
jgi:hypothetical protein